MTVKVHLSEVQSKNKMAARTDPLKGSTAAARPAGITQPLKQ